MPGEYEVIVAGVGDLLCDAFRHGNYGANAVLFLLSPAAR